MSNDFKDVMSKRTDEELIKIITIEKEDYQPIAVLAAEEEIKRRGIETTKVEQVKSELTAKFQEKVVFDSKIVGSITRLVHFIVDSLAFIIIMLILGFIIGLFYNTNNQTIIQFSGYLILTFSFFGYYIFMEHKFQKTLGKFITKTRVVNKDGERAALADIVRRTFCRLIPFDRISFIFTQNGLHDRLSDTTVVND